MCRNECVVDYYRGCKHYVLRYYTGVVYDCQLPNCTGSAAHMHKTARKCPCSQISYDERKVANLFHFPCDECKDAAEHELLYRRGAHRYA